MPHAHYPEETIPLNSPKIDLKEKNKLTFYERILEASFISTEVILVAATAVAIFQPIDQAVAEACGSANDYIYWWLIIRASIGILELSLQAFLYIFTIQCFCLNTSDTWIWHRVFLYLTRMAYGAVGLTISFMIVGNAFCLNTMFQSNVSARITILFFACWLFVLYDAVIAGKYYSNNHIKP